MELSLPEPNHFIEEAINEDLRNGVYTKVQTRFPPEPNGYLHIGHAKAININFGIAKKYGGTCNLRLDDTNPVKEDLEYVEAIQEDIRWLGYEWDNLYYASDYFDFIFECALKLIDMGKAYVCDLSADEIRETRGTLTAPGQESPYRNRSIEENRDLFLRMAAGEFENGAKVLRAKIDMASPNLNLRDPVIYRILHATHHRTGDKWCIYPMYDFAHPLSDAAEGVSFSLCSLEFENHRPLYDWFLRELQIPTPPRQIEFARMNVNYTVTSKRKCLRLVDEGYVAGWDDPRMVTLSGLRRRGIPPQAILDFCDRIGVSKAYSVIDYAMLEACARNFLNQHAPRTMAVLRPLPVVVENFPEGEILELEVPVNPADPEAGNTTTCFSRHLFIEREDFSLNPPKGYFRMSPDTEVRLKGAFIVKCTGYDTDEQGNVTAVRCTYDPDSKGGNAADGRKVKGTIHWVSAENAADAEVRLYDRLFTVENPADEESGRDYTEVLNPDSLQVLTGCKIEKSMAAQKPGTVWQFLRQGYFTPDYDSTPEKPIFNRTVSLKDSFGKSVSQG